MEQEMEFNTEQEADKDLVSLATELGLDLATLTGKDESNLQMAPNSTSDSNKGKKGKGKNTAKTPKEPEAAKTPKEPTQPKEPKEPKESKVTVDKNAKVLEIHGIPANYQARPIEYDEEGKPKELKVKFNPVELEQFRTTNGRIVLNVKKDQTAKKGQSLFEVVEERIDGTSSTIISINNKNKGLKRAKTWAVLLKLAFDPAKDVVVQTKENMAV